MHVAMKKNDVRFDMAAYRRFEQSSDFVFSEEYLSFLEEYNGGTPESNTFQISSKRSSSVTCFFGITGRDSDDLVRKDELFADRLGDDLRPIAELEGGNLLCMNSSGAVLYWDHELEAAGSAASQLAASFNEFIDRLKPFDPESVELRPEDVKSAWISPNLLKKLGKLK